MSEHDPRERAFSRTREAAARETWIAAVLARRRGRPLEPGDLCVLPATEAYPVEWALVERDLEDPGRLLAVPADTFPPAGSGDVEVPESETAGPLRLRCRFALRVPEGALAPARRTGVLAPRWLREAGALHEALAAGHLPYSSLREEIDEETEYRDWERDVLVPARAALERAAASAPASRRRDAAAGFTRAHQLAAVFLLAAVGLGIWAAQLRRQLGEPAVGVSFALTTERSSGQEVRVPRDATHVILVVQPEKTGDGWRIEIENARGRRIGPSDPVPAGAFEVAVTVPRRNLPDGTYRILLIDAADQPAETWQIDVQEMDRP